MPPVKLKTVWSTSLHLLTAHRHSAITTVEPSILDTIGPINVARCPYLRGCLQVHRNQQAWDSGKCPFHHQERMSTRTRRGTLLCIRQSNIMSAKFKLRQIKSLFGQLMLRVLGRGLINLADMMLHAITRSFSPPSEAHALLIS